MAIAQPALVRNIPGARRAIRIVPVAAFCALTFAGAGAVIAGSYATWAMFYAGLVARNGVSGHGKYFIAAAAVAILAALLSSMRSLSSLRSLVPLAGAAIALVALRDLRNLNAIIDSRAAAFYVPARGDGLFIVIGGAALLIAAFLVAPASPLPARGARFAALLALVFCAAVGMTIAGAYGEYYPHLPASSHAAHRAAPLQSAHVFTVAGAALLISVFSASMYRLGAVRKTAAARSSG